MADPPPRRDGAGWGADPGSSTSADALATAASTVAGSAAGSGNAAGGTGKLPRGRTANAMIKMHGLGSLVHVDVEDKKGAVRVHRMIVVKGKFEYVENLTTDCWVKYGTNTCSDILYNTLKSNAIQAPLRRDINPTKKRSHDDMMDIDVNPVYNVRTANEPLRTANDLLGSIENNFMNALNRVDELENTVKKMKKEQDERDATDLMNMFGDMNLKH